MATRRERVVLELEDRLSAGMIRTVIATRLADQAISDLDGSTVRTNKTLDVGATQATKQARGLDELESSARRAERGSSALLDIAAGFGPAFLPIGAVAIPALAGLTAELGFAAAAGGTMIAAFYGMGDALKALDAYQLEPTAANLQKLHQAMGALGPDGQAFVRQLDALEPRLKQLKLAAEAGILPGVSDSLDSLLTRLPQVRRIVSEISDTTGDLFADAGDSLAGSDYNEFFDYLETNARPILDDLGRTVGNLTLGMANLFTATAPQQQGFSDWLLGVSRGFEGWSDDLPENAGFAELMKYVDESGPRVADTLGAIGNAVVQIAQAAAPVSIPALKALETLANIVGKIADSPLGTTLIGLASGIALVNRALATSTLAKDSLVADLIYGKPLSSGGRGPNAIGQVGDRFRGLSAGVRAENVALRAAQQEQALILNRLRTQAQVGALVPRADRQQTAAAYVASQRRIEEATKRVTEAEKARSTRIGETAARYGKGAAVVGGLAFATSGLADKMALANTASYAMLGTIAGPWGAAIGGGIGLVQDLAEANDSLTASYDEMDRLLGSNTSTTSQLLAKRKELLAQVKESRNNYDSPNPFKGIPAVIAEDFGINARLEREAELALGKTRDMNARAAGEAAGLGSILVQGITPGLQRVAQEFDSAQAASNRFYESLGKYNAKLDLRSSLRAQAQALADFRELLKNKPKGTGGAQAQRDREASLDAYGRQSLDVASKTSDPVLQSRQLSAARRQFVALAEAMGMARPEARKLASSIGLVADAGSKAGRKTKSGMRDAKKGIDDTSKAAQGFDAYLTGLGGKSVSPKVDVKDKAARSKLAGVLAIAGVVDKQRPTPVVNLSDNKARADSRALKAFMNSLFGRTIVQTVRTNKIGTNGNGGNDLAKPKNSGSARSRTGGGSTSRTYTSDSARSASRTVVQVTTPSLDGVRLGGTVRIDGNMLNLDDAYLVAEEVVGNAFAGRESTARTQYAASSPGLPSGFE